MVQSPKISSVLKLLDSDAFTFIDFQTPKNDLFQLIADARTHLPSIEPQRELVPQVVLHLARRIGCISMEQLEDEDPKSPHIGLRTVYTLDEAFRRHV